MIPSNTFWFNNTSSQNPQGSFDFSIDNRYLVSDYAGLLDGELSGASKKFSFVIRFKRSLINGSYQTIFSRDNNTGGRQFAIEFDDRNRLVLYLFTTAASYTSWTTNLAYMNTGKWYSLVFTYDGTLALANRVKGYIDGTLVTLNRVDTSAGLSTIQSVPLEPLYIAVTNYGGLINDFKGYLNKIIFYTDVLTQGDVTLLYNSGNEVNEKTLATTIPAYLMWNPGAATFAAGFDMDDSIGTSYPSGSTNFSSVNMILADKISDVPVYIAPIDILLSAISPAVSTAQQGYMSTLMDALIAAGMTTDGDCVQVYANETEQAASLNWLCPNINIAVPTGSPVFTAGQGYLGASGKYVKTGLTLNSGTGTKQSIGNSTLNDVVVSFYSRTANLSTTRDIGASDGLGQIYSYTKFTDNNSYTGVNNSGASHATGVPTNSQGFFSIGRTAVNTDYLKRNSTTVVTGSQPSVQLVTTELAACGFNNAGVFVGGERQLSCFMVYKNSVDESAVRVAFQAYMTSLGTNV